MVLENHLSLEKSPGKVTKFHLKNLVQTQQFLADFQMQGAILLFLRMA